MAKAELILGIVPGDAVRFSYDGATISGFEGEGIAGAMLRNGNAGTRVTARASEIRGYYCGMGICWECVVEVVGDGFVRGCQYPVRAGLVVRSASVRTAEDL